MERTEWFPGHIKPVRIGFYERKYRDAACLVDPDWFDGRNWYYGSNGQIDTICRRQDREWRGLKENPHAD